MNKEKEIKTENGFNYFAFISYNKEDERAAKRLHRVLEQWRLPASLVKKREMERRPMRKLFFAPSDIVPRELEDELKRNLEASEHLIVVCSPTSAKSEWVGFEIDYFCSLGRQDKVHLIIVEGEPKSQDPEKECLHPNLKKHFKDLLAANIKEKHFKLPYLNRQRAYVQLIASLLDLDNDVLWRRHRRRLIERCFMIFLLAVAFVFSLFAVNQMSKPIDIRLTLNEKTVHNPNLPPLSNAKVILEIGGNKFDTIISAFDDTLVFNEISRSSLKDSARLKIMCEDWFEVDTTLIPTKMMSIEMGRNATVYGEYEGKLYSYKTGKTLANYKFSVEGVECVTDENGWFKIFVPLEKQKETMLLKCDLNPQGFPVIFKRENGGELCPDYEE
ncbi:MAG: toll/interleukin-1 receptor domain-containing protein [Bacteroidales bacterium]|nr:toll/interleukin-1 receptor domain-containing protein [Bacteroidales bacterium]